MGKRPPNHQTITDSMKQCSDQDEFDEGDETFGEPDGEEDEGEDTASCPYCSIEIDEDQDFCIHCGSYIITSENRPLHPK